MEKIKRLEEVILSPSTLLAEVIKPKRYIISPDGTEDKDSYARVLRIHEETIKDIKPGDIVIKYGGSMAGYTINAGKSNEQTFVIMHRGNITIAVTEDNFIDPDLITARVNV
jgi:ribosomal protein L27